MSNPMLDVLPVWSEGHLVGIELGIFWFLLQRVNLEFLNVS